MTNSKTIKIGSKIKLKLGKKMEVYKIVQPHQADVQEDKISCDSPLGNALLGHGEGEIVEIKTSPEESVKYKIEEIQ
jgi:transcription elongation factor GreA